MELHGFKNNSICTLEAIGLAKCFDAYSDINSEKIFEIGFNENSGNVYIALENNISILSMLGRRVEYLVTDLENGEEFFFDNFTDALNKADTL
jgi:hypothetical protein